MVREENDEEKLKYHPSETTPLNAPFYEELGSDHPRALSIREKAELFDEHALAAERISKTLLALDDGELEHKRLCDSLDLSHHALDDGDDDDLQKNGILELLRGGTSVRRVTSLADSIRILKSSRASLSSLDIISDARRSSTRAPIKKRSVYQRIGVMVCMAIVIFIAILTVLALGNITVIPPNQPVGPYKLVEIQEGEDLFNYYNFYTGKDSAGSNGYITYVSKDKAFARGIANITYETLSDIYSDDDIATKEPFVYMSTAPTKEGPRDSIRLEGIRRYNRGLFIIDLRHMPAGCGTWPAWWLTDEANWPINGEIDIVEGVNTQSVAKTALHTTRECKMDDVPLGVRNGTWDIAQGVPDHDGTVDMTARPALNCFVYDPHQWLNQGCVAVSSQDGSLGTPLNAKGGGVFVLEWDPVNRYLRTWVFSPHRVVPANLRETMKTASSTDFSIRVAPNPHSWGLPYGYYPIGDGTNCPSSHFRNMRLIFNLALCGTVSGNRFFLDCPAENKEYGSCENFVTSDPKAMDEAYWKVRGVYVYEREWERTWV